MILDDIVTKKKEEVALAKRSRSLESLKKGLANIRPRRPFREALRKDPDRISVIAELKKASPSRGILCKEYCPEEIASIYEAEGASALSVLTDHSFFSGALGDLKKVRVSSNLPILRKDFIIDPYQIFEAALAGADCVLLITSLVKERLREFLSITQSLYLDALVEIHTESELQRALDQGADLIGINNRDLTTMKVDMKTSQHLIPKISKECTVVVESGIRDHSTLLSLQQLGAHAALIGEAFMAAPDLASRVREIIHGTS
jgi:indole-3-glycerol phosphate synthase